ncbi:MAG: hypothetical protein INR72_14515, partial [Williamsia herbipolensis]|nr:hypothetical protein [Williamsia herbipolensis]
MLLPAVADEPSDGASPTRRSRGRLIGWLAAAAVVLAVVGFYLIDVLRTRGEIERNTVIAGVDVSGRTPDEARDLLRQQVQAQYTAPVTLDVHGSDVRLQPAQAGL